MSNVNYKYTAEKDFIEYYKEKHGEEVPIEDVKEIFRCFKLYLKKLTKEKSDRRKIKVGRLFEFNDRISIRTVETNESEGIKHILRFIYNNELNKDKEQSKRITWVYRE